MLTRRCRFSSYANVLALHKITRKLPSSPPFLPVSLSVEPLIILWNCHFSQFTGKDPPPHLPLYSAQHCSKSLSISSFITFTIQVFLWNRASRCNTEHKRSDDCARNSTENENVLRMSLLNKLNRKNWNENCQGLVLEVDCKRASLRKSISNFSDWKRGEVSEASFTLLQPTLICWSSSRQRGLQSCPHPKIFESPPPPRDFCLLSSPENKFPTSPCHNSSSIFLLAVL